MRAVVMRKIGIEPELEELVDPRPQRDEVLVRVVATGVCHSDLHVLKGEIGFPLPCVLGHEISGIVTELGEGVTNVAVGDRVAAPFIMPCGRCEFCARGEEDLCATFFALNRGKGALYDGTSRLAALDGSSIAQYSMAGFAEFSVIPSTAVFKVPDAVPLVDAAVLGCATFTAFGALRHAAGLRAGDSIAVVGTGGVGSAAIQLARTFGATRIVAIDIRDDKLEAARALGATDTVNAATTSVDDAVGAITAGRGVDIALEAFGHPDTVASALAAVRAGGKVVLAGLAAAGTTASFEITPLVRRKVSLVGSFGGRARTDMPMLLELAARGRIDPGAFITRRYRLDEAPEAFSALAHGEVIGRSVIVVGESA